MNPLNAIIHWGSKAEEEAILADIKAAKKTGAKAAIVHPSAAEPVANLVRAQQREQVKSLVQKVWEAPALYNRATRRAVGLLSHIWRWDLNANEETRRTYVPRYIRRHYTATPAVTRRQRRHRARIIAISRRVGII